MACSTLVRAAAVVILVLTCLAAVTASTATSGQGQQSSSRRLLGRVVDEAKCAELKHLQYDPQVNNVHEAYFYIDQELNFKHPCNLQKILKELQIIKDVEAYILTIIDEATGEGCGLVIEDLEHYKARIPADLEAACPPIDCKAEQASMDKNGKLTKEIITIIGKSKCLTKKQRSDLNARFGTINGLKTSNSISLSHLSAICPSLHEPKLTIKFPASIPADCP